MVEHSSLQEAFSALHEASVPLLATQVVYLETQSVPAARVVKVFRQVLYWPVQSVSSAPPLTVQVL